MYNKKPKKKMNDATKKPITTTAHTQNACPPVHLIIIEATNTALTFKSRHKSDCNGALSAADTHS